LERREEFEGACWRERRDPGRRRDALEGVGERSGRMIEELEDPWRVKTGAEEEEKESERLLGVESVAGRAGEG